MKRCILLLAAACITISCYAQDDDWELDEWSLDGPVSDTKGFFLNPHLNGAGIDIQGAENNASDGSGGGIGIKLGYGFSDLFSVFLNLDGTNLNPERGANYALGHADVGVMFTFLKPVKPARPFVGVAAAARNATFRRGDAEAKVSGPGITLMGGLRYFVSPTVSIDGELAVTGGRFNSIELSNDEGSIATDIDLEASSVRLILGISWFVGR